MAGELLKLFEEELDNPTRESLEKTALTLVSVSEIIIVPSLSCHSFALANLMLDCISITLCNFIH